MPSPSLINFGKSLGNTQQSSVVPPGTGLGGCSQSPGGALGTIRRHGSESDGSDLIRILTATHMFQPSELTFQLSYICLFWGVWGWVVLSVFVNIIMGTQRPLRRYQANINSIPDNMYDSPKTPARSNPQTQLAML